MALPPIGTTVTREQLQSLPQVGETITASQLQQLSGGQAQNLSFKQLPGNIIPSAGRLVGDVTQAVVHPVQTVSGIGNLLAGLIQKTVPGEQGKEEYANQFGRFLKNRYGSAEAVKRTAITDPVGMLADASALITGGAGLVRGGASVVSRVGNISRAGRVAEQAGRISRIGQLIDPMAVPVKGTVGTARLFAKGTGTFGATVTSTGESLKVLAEAIRKGDANQTNLALEAMKGKITPEELLEMGQKGGAKLKTARRTQYQETIANIPGATEATIKTSDIVDNIKSDKKLFNPVGTGLKPLIDPDTKMLQIDASKSAFRSDVKTVEAINNDLKILQETPDTDLISLHNLSQDIKQVQRKGAASPQGAAALDAIEDAIDKKLKQNKQYAAAQKEYSEFSNALNKVNKALGIGDRNASPVTAVNKLRTVLNDNREIQLAVLKELEQKAGISLKEIVAGMNLSPGVSKGFIGKGVLVGAILFGNISPRLILALAAANPRLLGETTVAINTALRAIDRVGTSPLGQMLGKIRQSVTPSQLNLIQDLLNQPTQEPQGQSSTPQLNQLLNQ